jgi:hypothetical protein
LSIKILQIDISFSKKAIITRLEKIFDYHIFEKDVD